MGRPGGEGGGGAGRAVKRWLSCFCYLVSYNVCVFLLIILPLAVIVFTVHCRNNFGILTCVHACERVGMCVSIHVF